MVSFIQVSKLILYAFQHVRLYFNWVHKCVRQDRGEAEAIITRRGIKTWRRGRGSKFSASTLPRGEASASRQTSLAYLFLWINHWCNTGVLTCSCGSIISGQRRPRTTSTAFSMETWSRGSPSVFHCRISKGSARTLMIVIDGVTGMPSSAQRSVHFRISNWRYTLVNAP